MSERVYFSIAPVGRSFLTTRFRVPIPRDAEYDIAWDSYAINLGLADTENLIANLKEAVAVWGTRLADDHPEYEASR